MKMDFFKYSFILLFLVMNACHMKAIRLYLDAESSTVSKGTEAKFDCYSSTIPQHFFERGGVVEWRRYPRFSSSMEIIARWTRDGGDQILLENPNRQYSIEVGQTLSPRLGQKLIIRHAQKDDQGTYFCAIFNSTGLQVTQSRGSGINLKVKYPPAEYYPICTATPANVGDKTELKCVSEKTTPGVELNWYKDGVKVSDGQSIENQVKSTYEVHADELSGNFECRLLYDDDAGIHVRQSCHFSQPSVDVQPETQDTFKGIYTYRAVAHASPPFVGNLNCTVEQSSLVTHSFLQEFPGYGTLTVGPVAVQSQPVSISCRAKNVLGETVVEKRVNITRTNVPLNVAIWPQRVVFQEGENTTLECSYTLVSDDSSLNKGASVTIDWKYNEDPIDASKSVFIIEGNVLHFSRLPREDREATISCRASVVDGTTPSEMPPTESSAEVRIMPAISCAPQPAESAHQGGSQQQSMLPFIVGVSILGLVLFVLVVVLTSVLWKKGKSRDASHGGNTILDPVVTFQAFPTTGAERVEDAGQHNTIQRALPAQPVEFPETTTLRSVVTSSALLGSDTLTRQRIGSVSSSGVGTISGELPYQEMVGDTGVVKSRHGSVTNDARPNYHALLGRSKSIPASMVPGPNGGFLPPNVAAANGHLIQRSASEGHDSDSDVCYEDPDAVRERRRLRRAMSNDYQPATSPLVLQKEMLLAQYANALMQGDDSVFPALAV